MKPVEWTYLLIEPFIGAIYRVVRKHLREIVESCSYPPRILDVGGRTSSYTIGIPAAITITDLPRESDVQEKLELGLSDELMETIRLNRSNVEAVIHDNMTNSKLENDEYDCVIAVEVLEHVEDDHAFISEIYRVLKEGGTFMMTTPNGNFVRNTNPAHIRHYRKEELELLLSSKFEKVSVEYAIQGGIFHSMGRASWSLKQPLRTIRSMICNLVNSVQSGKTSMASQNTGTMHLLATAWK